VAIRVSQSRNGLHGTRGTKEVQDQKHGEYQKTECTHTRPHEFVGKANDDQEETEKIGPTKDRDESEEPHLRKNRVVHRQEPQPD
jgi:hypothetical protein